MNSLQDESSVTKTSSERDDSDFMCPDSGLMTQDCTCVKCSHIMAAALLHVGSMSLNQTIAVAVLELKDQRSESNLLMSPNLRDQQRVHNQRVHNQRVHNQRVEEGLVSTLDWD
ncbi:uncharacterized protein LOC144459817 isoform X3 [Epinephelus lanceolatus]